MPASAGAFGLMALTLLAGPGANAERLSLTCSGTERQGHAAAPARPVPWRAALDIDLSAATFCWGACAERFPIARVEGDRLVLVSRDGPDSWGQIVLRRRTGKLDMDIAHGDIVTLRKATCRPR